MFQFVYVCVTFIVHLCGCLFILHLVLEYYRYITNGDRQDSSRVPIGYEPEILPLVEIGSIKKRKDPTTTTTNEWTIIIKPKDGGATLGEIMKRKIRSNTILRSITSRKGYRVIKSTSPEDFDRIAEVVGEDAEVVKGVAFHPQIKLYAVDSEIEEQEIIEAVGGTDQARILRRMVIKKETVKSDQGDFVVLDPDRITYLIEVKAETFRQLMVSKTVSLRGGDHVYRCKENTEAYRCFRCQGFGHSHSRCKYKLVVCGSCAGEHETATCESESVKCFNCAMAGKPKGKCMHPATDRHCPIARRSVQFRLRNTIY